MKMAKEFLERLWNICVSFEYFTEISEWKINPELTDLFSLQSKEKRICELSQYVS